MLRPTIIAPAAVRSVPDVAARRHLWLETVDPPQLAGAVTLTAVGSRDTLWTLRPDAAPMARRPALPQHVRGVLVGRIGLPKRDEGFIRDAGRGSMARLGR